MKKIIIALVVVALGLGIYYTFSSKEEVSLDRTHTDEALGISFEYLEGYVALEIGSGTSTPEIIKTIVLMEEAEYQSILNGEREGGEGPPSLVIMGHQNPENLSPLAWAEANPALSNYNLKMGEVSETEVGGREAIQYEADGLYANQNVIFANEGRIYVINGSFIDRESKIYQDFKKLVESVRIN